MKTHMQVRYVGKAQESWIAEAINMYTTRCSLFGKFELLEAPEGHDKSAKPNITKGKSKEAATLLNNLPKDALLIAMDEKGRQMDSIGFSKVLESASSKGQSIVFFIGGSWGLDASVLDKSHLTISLGRMTLPHSLARIVLLEQLYRAQMILAGREYHK